MGGHKNVGRDNKKLTKVINGVKGPRATVRSRTISSQAN